MNGNLPFLPEHSLRLLRRLVAALSTCCVLTTVAACASSPAAAQPPIRVLVEFRDPVDGAAADLLSQLQQRSGVAIRYATAVSPKLHAYLLSCPADHCAAAIAALRREPAILDITPDLLRKPIHTTP